MKTETINNKVREYFSSINSTSRRMMIDLQSISESQKRNNASAWNGMSFPQQQELLYRELVRTKVKEKYSYYPSPDNGPPSFPKLVINSGEKMIVDPEHEDSTNNKGTGRLALQGVSWRDEHSAPFSWETRSQLEVSLNDDNPENMKNLRNSQIHYEDLVLEKWKFQFPDEQGSEIAPNEVLKELGLNLQSDQKNDWNLGLPKENSQKNTWNLPEENQKLERNLPYENSQKIVWNVPEVNPSSEWNLSEEENFTGDKDETIELEDKKSENLIKSRYSVSLTNQVDVVQEVRPIHQPLEDERQSEFLTNPIDVVQELIRQIPQPLEDDDDDDLSIPKTGFDFLDNW